MKNENQQEQIYVEMEVPPDGSILRKFVQEQFHESIFVDYTCEFCRKIPGQKATSFELS